MIITCEKCTTRYKVADDIVDRASFKVRCARCGHKFIFHRPMVQEASFVLEEAMTVDCHRFIAVSNQKGGVAKTSTSLNLGMSLATLGKKVLLVDLDVQANLTILLGFRQTRSFFDLLESPERNVLSVVERTRYPNLFLFPSNSKMALLKKRYLNEHNFEYLLKKLLEPIKEKFDHIVIDTPPAIEFFTLNALVASNLVIIPTICEYLAMHGINQITDIIKALKKEVNKDIDYKVLITMYDSAKTAENVMCQKIRSNFSGHLFNTVISYDDKMQESHIHNLPVIQYDRKSSSAGQYMELAREIIGGG